MNEYKEVMRITPRRRNKTQIIVIGFSLVVLIFVIHQILTNFNVIWKRHVDVEEYDIRDIYFDQYDTQGRFSSKNSKFTKFQGEKLIHLDLKGAPPLVSYFKKFFPFIKSLGATGVLIEYEDMFYYNEELEDLRALNAYNPSDIKTILKLAEKNGLQVFPLIQTFGHLEFLLKLEKFKDLREVDAYPQVLCPTHERVQLIIRKMIDQVLKVHPKSKYIHIGCDEVMYLGECGRCRTVMHQNNWSSFNLFLNHVKSIATYINETYPGVRPIMWGDMLPRIDRPLLEESQISSLVDLMVWKYVPNVSEYITSDLLQFYAKMFKSIWIASAFKGATGVNQIVTNANYHLANHKAWMNIVMKWKKYINFKGIAITGWQRYDHFALLCELLPVGIPSLALSMHYLNGSGKALNKESLAKILQCNRPFSIAPSVDFKSAPNKCDFPGFPVFHLVNKFSSFTSNIEVFSVRSSGWFSVYNIVHKFSSPAYVKSMFDRWPVESYLEEIRTLEKDLKEALSEVYDEHTVKEWILSYVTPVRLRLEALYNAKDVLMKQHVWPRRPLLNNSDDLEKAAGEICTADQRFGCALLLL